MDTGPSTHSTAAARKAADPESCRTGMMSWPSFAAVDTITVGGSCRCRCTGALTASVSAASAASIDALEITSGGAPRRWGCGGGSTARRGAWAVDASTTGKGGRVGRGAECIAACQHSGVTLLMISGGRPR
jgi:hypothetical protein